MIVVTTISESVTPCSRK